MGYPRSGPRSNFSSLGYPRDIQTYPKLEILIPGFPLMLAYPWNNRVLILKPIFRMWCSAPFSGATLFRPSWDSTWGNPWRNCECILPVDDLDLSSRARRLPRSGSTSLYICPPPDPKSKKGEAYVKSKGILYDRYDAQLHFAITHFCRVNARGPPHASGRKQLDLLGPANQPR